MADDADQRSGGPEIPTDEPAGPISGRPPLADPHPQPSATFTFNRTFTFGSPPPADADVTVVPGRSQRWEWRWSPQDATTPEDVDEPATYYEALTGRRDAQRDFFIRSRRILDRIVWGIALGVPAAIVALAIVTGQSLETVVFIGIAAFAVGMMFRHSFPRTPFG